MISVDKFRDIEMRVGTVEKVEEISGSKNLYKLTVNIGDEKRQVISGIKKYYKPEDLEGKQFVFVTNLEHATLMGQKSEAMILAATDENKDKVILIKPEKYTDNGMKLT
ncbi:MAG: methionine--tRNA ligase subunit beta [Candidatus Aenigmarchaeota archaeon]|nr:methionine--tRNA ligase subunit beta [Candidatus Aenigmarchaeota archaeon]